MVAACIILTLAWTISGVCRDLLSTGPYVAHLVETSGVPVGILPALIFVVACFLSFSTGTAWGTFGILIPIIISICEVAAPELLIVTLSATLAGSRIRRSHIPDLRYDDPGVYWCTVQPPETRWNSGTICLHRSRMLSDRIYHRRLYRQTGTGCLHGYHTAVCTGSALYRAYHHAQDRRSCKISEQSCTGINRSEQNDKTITNHITKTRSEKHPLFKGCS